MSAAFTRSVACRGFLCPHRWDFTSAKTRASMAAMRAIVDQELSNNKLADAWKSECVITSKQDANINITGAGKQVLNLCANNYLGLSSHPEVVKAAQEAVNKYGAGLSSNTFICGTQDIHKELEQKIANFHGREDAILYPSCFDANAGIFETLLTADDAVLCDELNHASIIDGFRSCKAQKHLYLHSDMEDLEAKLTATKDTRLRLIVTDGVFSKDGDVAQLKDICYLADKYKALVLMDECLATGFFGRTGRGTEEYWGLDGQVDIINSTLVKALGGAGGGYTTGPKPLIDLLRKHSRPYLFSNILPPPVVASVSKVFDILNESSELIDQLSSNTKTFRSHMVAAGFNVGGDLDHPITSIILGDARLTSWFADALLEQDIYVNGLSFPVVPKGRAQIQVQLSAVHSDEDVNRMINAFIDIGKKLKVIYRVFQTKGFCSSN